MSCHQLGRDPCRQTQDLSQSQVCQPANLSGFKADSPSAQQLKQILSEQIDAQHTRLLQDVQSLHANFFSNIQQEIQTLRQMINTNPVSSGSANDQSLLQDEQKLLNSSPEMMQKDSADEGETQPSPQPSPMSNLTRSSTRLHVSSLHNHPDLHAFLQAKNWEPESFNVETGEDMWDTNPKEENTPPKDHHLRARLRQLVEASWFDLSVGSVIVLNALVMSLKLEYDGLHTADLIGISRDGGNWPSADISFTVFQHIFTLFFLVELLLKLIVYGYTFFKQFWNWLDFIIVVSAVLETYIFALIDVSGPNMSFMRLLRMGKIVKVLRIVRVLRVFSQLRILLVSIACSLPALAWSMALLAVVQLIASIFMTQSLQGWLQDENNDPEVREFVFEYFGSFSRSQLSMLEMTLAPGTWSRFGRLIIYKVNRMYMIFFFGYATIISFAVIRVISAIFLKETLNAAAKDGEVVMAELNRNPDFVRGIKKVFEDTDVDGSGHISLDELDGLLHNEQAEAFLSLMGIQANAVAGLFSLMDDGDDKITFAEFLAGVMRLKAHGGIDLVTLLYENKRILAKIVKVEQMLAKDIRAAREPTEGL